MQKNMVKIFILENKDIIQNIRLEYPTELFNYISFIVSKNYTQVMLMEIIITCVKRDSEYYNEFMDGIISIFNKYEKYGTIRFDFHTEKFIGKT